MTTIAEYLTDRRLVVRHNGRDFDTLTASMREQLAEIDMGDCIIKKANFGYVTVTSRNSARPLLGLIEEPPKRQQYQRAMPRFSPRW